MTLRRSLTLAVILSVAPAVFNAPGGSAFAAAAKAKTGKKPKAKKSKAQPKDKAVTPDAPITESGEISGASKKQLLGNAGLSPSPMLGIGGTFGMIKDNGSGIEATLLMSSGKVDKIVAAQITHIGGRYRKGLTKSLYGAGGAGFRMASGKWNVLNQTADAEYPAGASLNAVTLDGAIGAQFKMGSILIGADALGISFPLFKMGVKKTAPSEEDYDTADADTQQAKFDKAAAGMIITIAKVGVGIEF
jgi:hypothetical protein